MGSLVGAIIRASPGPPLKQQVGSGGLTELLATGIA